MDYVIKYTEVETTEIPLKKKKQSYLGGKSSKLKVNV